MKNIADIAHNKKEEYKQEYIAWSLENKGQIMSGILSKEMGAEMAGFCETIDEIDTLIRITKRRLKFASENKQVNGHRWVIEGLEAVRDEYIKQCELQYFL